MTDASLPRPELVVVEPDDWIERAATELETAIVDSVERLGRCVVGISGGSTPNKVFRLLGTRALPWDRITLVQVDERVAAIGSEARNLTEQLEAFTGLPVRWLPLPVADPIEEGIADFVDGLRRETHAESDGIPIIDVLHLGLGADGHTASLVPGDPVLDVTDRLLAITGVYRGNRRITLTRPVLDRARLVIWLVEGAAKAPALERLMRRDRTIPAGLIAAERSIVVADTSAAARL